jgi:hypothetical protein
MCPWRLLVNDTPLLPQNTQELTLKCRANCAFFLWNKPAKIDGPAALPRITFGSQIANRLTTGVDYTAKTSAGYLSSS